MGWNSSRASGVLMITICLCLMLSTSFLCTVDNQHAKQFHLSDSYIPASHDISRRDAIVDYVLALYSPEDGAFYGWLEATPTDLRIARCPGIHDVYKPYTILKQLGSTGVLDWSNCTDFLKSIVNVNPNSMEYYGLVNYSQITSPGVISCRVAALLFPEFGLDDWLYTDEIAQFIASTQTANGGFRLRASNDDPAEMITTWSALRALQSINRLSVIDTTAAISFVLSCYQDDGGFSNVPDIESLLDIVPLGLFCLDILGRTDLIRTQNTTDYLLQYWDNDEGNIPGGTVVNTERLIWSLYTLGTLDQINLEIMLSWVVSCQTTHNGAFLPIPNYDLDSERLEWIRAAVHILHLCNRMDLLDETITVFEYPEYQVPQWYIDYINENFGTTTDNGIFPVLPNIDFSAILAILATWSPIILVLTLVSIPGILIVRSNRMKKLERRERRKRRKQTKRN